MLCEVPPGLSRGKQIKLSCTVNPGPVSPARPSCVRSTYKLYVGPQLSMFFQCGLQCATPVMGLHRRQPALQRGGQWHMHACKVSAQASEAVATASNCLLTASLPYGRAVQLLGSVTPPAVFSLTCLHQCWGLGVPLAKNMYTVDSRYSYQ